MAIIYKIENDVNEKIYVGATKRDMLKRFNEHKSMQHNSRRRNMPLYDAMDEIGAEHF